MENDDNKHLNPSNKLDELLNSILDKEVLDTMAIEEDEGLQYLDRVEKESKAILGAYCIENELVSQDFVDMAAPGRNTVEFYNALDVADRNKIYVFEKISLARSTFITCEPDSYLGELEEIREIIGSVAQTYTTHEERAPWFGAIRDIVLPLTKQLPSAEFEMAVEQADILHDLKNLEDQRTHLNSEIRKIATSAIEVLLETTYGAHDDINELARVIVAVAQFRYLDFPLQVYEEQLEGYVERYPLAEMCVDTTVALLRAELDS